MMFKGHRLGLRTYTWFENSLKSILNTLFLLDTKTPEIYNSNG